uniref:Uncharacterized protein n=1 Tax=Myotis myotis TaxID=51298 RepID=A0A7J7VI70_MYOMY|nr:hypothetical protein mMyoMyo1_008308 [Myotis myotis]
MRLLKKLAMILLVEVVMERRRQSYRCLEGRINRIWKEIGEGIKGKRKQGGLSLEEEEEEEFNGESGGSSSEEEDRAAEEEEGTGSEDARKRKEDELWTNFLNDVGPKSKVSPSPHSRKREETKEMSSNKLLVKAEELEKPKKLKSPRCLILLVKKFG